MDLKIRNLLFVIPVSQSVSRLVRERVTYRKVVCKWIISKGLYFFDSLCNYTLWRSCFWRYLGDNFRHSTLHIWLRIKKENGNFIRIAGFWAVPLWSALWRGSGGWEPRCARSTRQLSEPTTMKFKDINLFLFINEKSQNWGVHFHYLSCLTPTNISFHIHPTIYIS